jgi:hypothetical protein
MNIYGSWVTSPLGDISDPSDTVNQDMMEHCPVHGLPTMDGFDYKDDDWRCCDAC